MSADGDALYKSDMFLLTLKGWITVHFMDEQALEGEYITQDTLNIFLNIDGTPIMIPRSQIRYIQGEPGQPIEEDTSLLQPHSIKTEETLAPGSTTPKTAEMPLPLEPYHETPQPEIAGLADESVDDDDDDDDGGTFVLEAEDMDDIYAASTQEANLADTDTDVDNVEDSGMTFVLDEAAGISSIYEDETVLEADLDLEDEATVLLDEEGAISAQLICTDGPHAGESFKLTGAVFTMGRATDNDLPLPGDKEISRRHAIITRDMGRFRIQDQNSLNGTFVNEVRLDSPRYLENGDIILIGISYIEYQEY